MKIAFVTYGLGLGGTDRVCCHLARGFHGLGDQVQILACANGGQGQPALKAIIEGGPTLTLLTRKKWGNRQVQKMMALPTYVRWLRAERPDFVVATGNNICRFTALGFRLARIASTSRLVIKTTNPVVRRKKSLSEYIRRRAFGRAFRAASAVLTLSKEEASLLARTFPDAANHFHPVYNPYLTEAFEQATAVPNKASVDGVNGPTVMLAVGRLHHQKNYARMLRAFAMLIESGRRDLLLRIIGDGPDRQQITALINELGIADRVEMPGYTTDIPHQMARADVLLLSSDYEGLPAVVIEALACDCPVISTNCFPMAKALLEPLPGCLVVDGKDDSSFAAAMGKWLDMPRIRPTLRPHALHYTTASAVQSHRTAMLQGFPNDNRE